MDDLTGRITTTPEEPTIINPQDEVELIKASQVTGLKVISIDNGKTLDDVSDVIYDSSDHRIHALLVNSAGLFADAKVILLEDIKSIGKDAVIIESEQLLKNSKDIPERIHQIAKADNYLTNTKIVTEDGTQLGEVTDVLFHPKTGYVQQLEVSQGGLRNLQSGKKFVSTEDIVTVGKDTTIVSSFTEEKFSKQPGGIQGAVSNTGEKGQNVFDDLKDRFQVYFNQITHVNDDPEFQRKKAATNSSLVF